MCLEQTLHYGYPTTNLDLREYIVGLREHLHGDALVSPVRLASMIVRYHPFGLEITSRYNPVQTQDVYVNAVDVAITIKKQEGLHVGPLVFINPVTVLEQVREGTDLLMHYARMFINYAGSVISAPRSIVFVSFDDLVDVGDRDITVKRYIIPDPEQINVYMLASSITGVIHYRLSHILTTALEYGVHMGISWEKGYTAHDHLYDISHRERATNFIWEWLQKYLQERYEMTLRYVSGGVDED